MENETDGINEQMSTLLDQMGKNKDNPDPVIDQFIQTMGWDLINKRLAAMQDREDQERRELAMDAWEDFGNPMDKFRRTGRTTRMLEYAVRKAASGKNVVVYSVSFASCGMLARIMAQVFSDMVNYPTESTQTLFMTLISQLHFSIGREPSVIPPGTITFRPISRVKDNFDRTELREYDLPPRVISLIDHWALECLYSKVCQELYRFMPDPIREDDKENNQDKIPPEPPEPNITAL